MCSNHSQLDSRRTLVQSPVCYAMLFNNMNIIRPQCWKMCEKKESMSTKTPISLKQCTGLLNVVQTPAQTSQTNRNKKKKIFFLWLPLSKRNAQIRLKGLPDLSIGKPFLVVETWHAHYLVSRWWKWVEKRYQHLRRKYLYSIKKVSDLLTRTYKIL